jgi:hypothetical protein
MEPTCCNANLIAEVGQSRPNEAIAVESGSHQHRICRCAALATLRADSVEKVGNDWSMHFFCVAGAFF